jgi:hypothetical protein
MGFTAPEYFLADERSEALTDFLLPGYGIM